MSSSTLAFAGNVELVLYDLFPLLDTVAASLVNKWFRITVVYCTSAV